MRRRRAVWVRPWLQRRNLLGQYERLMSEIRDEDLPAFKNFVRVEPGMFHELLVRLGDRIRKKDTWYRKALDPGLKLAITLRYLGAGDNYHSLMYGFRVAHNTISLIIRDVCEAIIAEFAEEVISCPTTPEEWRRIADQFAARWQLPHAHAALDDVAASALFSMDWILDWSLPLTSCCSANFPTSTSASLSPSFDLDFLPGPFLEVEVEGCGVEDLHWELGWVGLSSSSTSEPESTMTVRSPRTCCAAAICAFNYKDKYKKLH